MIGSRNVSQRIGQTAADNQRQPPARHWTFCVSVFFSVVFFPVFPEPVLFVGRLHSLKYLIKMIILFRSCPWIKKFG